MTLKLNGNTRIDNLRNYPSEVVEKLRALLKAGARTNPDPHRENFYDVEDGSRMFYIHVSPNGGVWLLASWQKRAPVPSPNQTTLASAHP
jgi:streptogramin lyase